MPNVTARGISDRELRDMRTAQEVFMPDIVTIRRKGFVGPDNFQMSTRAEDVHVRLKPGFGQWRNVADRFQGITPYTCTLPWDQEVVASDQVLDQAGRIFEVRDVQAPSTLLTARVCLLDLVNDASN